MSPTSVQSRSPDLVRRTGGVVTHSHPWSKKILAPQVTTSEQALVVYLDPLTYFYERLLPVETVEAIYADWHPDGLDVWLIVYDATEADREQIYNHEQVLMQTFPGLGLDTRLIDRSKVDPIEAVDLRAVDAFLRFPRSAYA